MSITPKSCVDLSCTTPLPWPGNLAGWAGLHDYRLSRTLPSSDSGIEILMPKNIHESSSINLSYSTDRGLYDHSTDPTLLVSHAQEWISIQLEECCGPLMRSITLMSFDYRKRRLHTATLWLKREYVSATDIVTHCWDEQFERDEPCDRSIMADYFQLANYLAALGTYHSLADYPLKGNELAGLSADPYRSGDFKFDTPSIWNGCCAGGIPTTIVVNALWDVARAIWLVDSILSIVGFIADGDIPGHIYAPVHFDRMWVYLSWGPTTDDLVLKVFSRRNIGCDLSYYYEDTYIGNEALATLACYSSSFVPATPAPSPSPDPTLPP